MKEVGARDRLVMAGLVVLGLLTVIAGVLSGRSTINYVLSRDAREAALSWAGDINKNLNALEPHAPAAALRKSDLVGRLGGDEFAIVAEDLDAPEDAMRSSLSFLARLPVKKIKIDRSFIDTLGTSEQTSAIVSSIVGLGQSLHVTITAEGVETEGQAAMLRKWGCDQVQGFYYGSPRPRCRSPRAPSPSSPGRLACRAIGAGARRSGLVTLVQTGSPKTMASGGL